MKLNNRVENSTNFGTLFPSPTIENAIKGARAEGGVIAARDRTIRPDSMCSLIRSA